MPNNIVNFGLAMMASSALMPISVMAQDENEEEATGFSGDIIVTANRRAESVQDVGIAINAFSGDTVDKLGLSSATELAQFAPAVSATGAQGGFLQTFSIRGVTQNDYNPHQESPVAAYLDETYISSVQGQSFAVFDTERVEILKGPQGTLFGRNATGGLVHYISRKPTDELTGYVSAKYGRFNSRQAEAAVGGGIADGVMVRVAGLYKAHDPILKNLGGPDQWDEDTYAGRVHLLLEPSEDFSALLSARYGKTSSTVSVANQYIASIAIRDAGGNVVGERLLGANENPYGTCNQCDFFGYRDPDGSGRLTNDTLVDGAVSVSTSPGDDRTRSEAYGFTANFEGTTGDLTITSISDYSHFKWRVGSSLTGGAAFPAGFDTFTDGIDQLSSEFRVSGDHDGFRWVAGVYYLSIQSDNGSAFGMFPSSAYGLPAGFLIDQVQDFDQDTEALSFFGQAEVDITPELTVISGVRYIDETKEFSYRSFVRDATGLEYYNLDAPFNINTNPDAKISDGLWSWKLGLNYKPNSDLLLYATVNRGVKSGGFNAPSVPVTGVVPFVFSPEKLMAYEAGFKSSLANRAIRLNGSVYYYDYTNYQAYRSIGFTNFIFNGDARSYGGELEFYSEPLDGLNLALGAAYNNSTVKDVQLSPLTVRDQSPAFSPEFELTGLVRYEHPVSFGSVAFQLDGSYTSKYYTQLTNYESVKNDGYVLFNGRVTVAGDEDKGWQLNAAVLNITDQTYKTSGFVTSGSFGHSVLAYNKPRTWEVGVRYSF